MIIDLSHNIILLCFSGASSSGEREHKKEGKGEEKTNGFEGEKEYEQEGKGEEKTNGFVDAMKRWFPLPWGYH